MPHTNVLDEISIQEILKRRETHDWWYQPHTVGEWLYTMLSSIRTRKRFRALTIDEPWRFSYRVLSIPRAHVEYLTAYSSPCADRFDYNIDIAEKYERKIEQYKTNVLFPWEDYSRMAIGYSEHGDCEVVFVPVVDARPYIVVFNFCTSL